MQYWCYVCEQYQYSNQDRDDCTVCGGELDKKMVLIDAPIDPVISGCPEIGWYW